MKDKIAGECVQLLRERNIDEITVGDVAKRCGISRQAFYYYFENIDAVLMYSVEGKIEELQRRCMEIRDPEEVLHVLTRSYRNQYILLEHLIQSKARLRVKRYYHTILYSIIKAQLELYCAHGQLEPGELDAKASFTAYGLGGLLYERCEDPGIDADELADEVYRFILKDIGRSFVKKEV